MEAPGDVDEADGVDVTELEAPVDKGIPEEKKSYAFLRILTWVFGFLIQIFGFLTHSYAMIFFTFKHFEMIR